MGFDATQSLFIDPAACRIVLIDADSDHRRMIRDELTAEKFSVVEIAGAGSIGDSNIRDTLHAILFAIGKHTTVSPDICSVCKSLAERYEVPVIVMGHLGREGKIDLLKAGVADFLDDDSPREEVTRKISTHIALRNASRLSVRENNGLTDEDFFTTRQMLQLVLDTIPQRVFWKDRNLIYVGCNKSLAQDCGYNDPSELVGKTDYETASAETADTYRADDRQVMETGIPKLNYEEPQIKPDGSRAWLMTSKVPLRDRTGKVIGVLGTYHDITSYKQLEQQFRLAQKMEAFGQLSGGIAHDFNNLLTIIKGNASLLSDYSLSDLERDTAIRDIQHAVEQGANLTRQLLTFSRRQLMQPRVVDLNEIVVNTITMLKRLIGEHIALEFIACPGIAPVKVDTGMMEQVLVNLAINSRDAMPKGGRLIVEIEPVSIGQAQVQPGSNARPGDFFRLRLTDTGCGIDPEHLPYIFEPFFTTKEIGKGTGLGLATIFGIVEQHEGWIEVESKVNSGTTFRLYFQRSKQPIEPATGAEQRAQVTGGNETILIVEDEKAIRQVLRMALSKFGYTVMEASSGPLALDIWNEHQSSIDLLLTDLVMPGGISGPELADRMRAIKPDLSTVYCSGYSADFFAAKTKFRTNEFFVHKPFELPKLLQVIRFALDNG
jgi:two-component system, cell cycle sensor histidine kinase and response regulator CckA